MTFFDAMNKQMTTKQSIIFIIVIAIPVFIAMQAVHRQEENKDNETRALTIIPKEIPPIVKNLHMKNGTVIQCDVKDKVAQSCMPQYLVDDPIPNGTILNKNCLIRDWSDVYNISELCPEVK
jgi:hypothetical protein